MEMNKITGSMKNIVLKLFPALLAFFAAVSCSKGLDDSSSLLEGEWKLASVGGVQASDLLQDKYGALDVYIAFYGNGSFETFQRLVDSGRYVRYGGTFTLSGDTATGTYDDGVSWGAPYTVRLEDVDARLVMSANGEDCVYTRTAIPEDVRTNAVAPVRSRSEEESTLAVPPRFL